MVRLLILKWFMMVALSEGVGLNSEQFTITTPTCTTRQQRQWGGGESM